MFTAHTPLRPCQTILATAKGRAPAVFCTALVQVALEGSALGSRGWCPGAAMRAGDPPGRNVVALRRA